MISRSDNMGICANCDFYTENGFCTMNKINALPTGGCMHQIDRAIYNELKIKEYVNLHRTHKLVANSKAFGSNLPLRGHRILMSWDKQER